MTRISEAVEQLQEGKAEVERLEIELTKAKARVKELSEETVPGIMAEMGVKSLALETGETVTVVPDFFISVRADAVDEAMQWFVKNDASAIIDVTVIADFEKGDHDGAEAAAKALREAGLNSMYELKIKRGIHAQTLKAFFKPRIEAGEATPEHLFNVLPFSKTTIKTKSKRGSK